MRTMPSEATPVNLVERIYVMVFMFFAFSAFAICVAMITQTFFKFSERKRGFDDDMAAVRSYMRAIKAPESVQSSVKAYLRHLFDRRKIHAKEASMLNSLPVSLNHMLKHSRLYPFLTDLPVMQILPESAYVYVSEMCEVKDMAPGTCICKQGRAIEAAFIVMSGLVSYEDSSQALDTKDPLILEGRVIDGECLENAITLISKRTLVAAVCTEVIRINRYAFFDLMLKHEEFAGCFSETLVCEDEDSDRDDRDEGGGSLPFQLYRGASTFGGNVAAATATSVAVVAS